MNEQKAKVELRADFVERANSISKAKDFKSLINAVCCKIDAERTTLSVAKQTSRHALQILGNYKYLNEVNAVQSVNAFFTNAKNIKAIAYIAMLSSKCSNNYLTLTIQHISKVKSATTETVCAMLIAHHYTSGTASAQKSMSVNALRAMRAIDFADTTKAAISQAENFQTLLEVCNSHVLTR